MNINLQKTKGNLAQLSKNLWYNGEGCNPVIPIIYESVERKDEFSMEVLLSASEYLSSITLEQLKRLTCTSEISQHLYEVITSRLSDIEVFVLHVPDGEEKEDQYRLENIIVLGKFSKDNWIAMAPNKPIDEDNFHEENQYSVNLDDSHDSEMISLKLYLEETTTGFMIWEDWGEKSSPDWLIITAQQRQGLIDKIIQGSRVVHQFPVNTLRENFLDCCSQEDSESIESYTQVDALEQFLYEQFSDFESYYFGRFGEFVLFLIGKVKGEAAKGGLMTHIAMT